MIMGRRLRIYYLTQVGVNPPRFVLFVNKPDLMLETYKKYLINNLREAFPFSGCPLIFDLRGKGPSKRTGSTPQVEEGEEEVALIHND